MKGLVWIAAELLSGCNKHTAPFHYNPCNSCEYDCVGAGFPVPVWPRAGVGILTQLSS